MKKLVLMFVAMAAISFASCGNKNESAAPAQDSADTTVVDSLDSTAVADTTVADTTVAE
jgi:predicted small lipoprotein YifL